MARYIICTGCKREKMHYGLGLCSSCYQWRRKSSIKGHRSQLTIDICVDCGKKKTIYALGLCRPCYDRQRKRPIITCTKCEERREHHGREMCSACYTRWRRQKNPKQWIAYSFNRIARKNSLPDTITAGEIRELLKIGQGTYPGEKLHLDHFVPLNPEKNKACGSTRANLHYIPEKFNRYKWDRFPEELYKQPTLF